MRYAVRDGVTFSIVNGQAVFFDLAADRFIGAPERANAAFALVMEGRSLDDDACADLAPLLGRNLLEPASDTSAPPRPIEGSAPEVDLGSVAPAAPSALLCASVVARHMMAQGMLKSKSLADVVARLRRLRDAVAAGPAGSSDRERDIAAAFRWANRFVTANDRCLQRSVALTLALLARGSAARFVMGVRRLPFAAHSWVQSDEMVLSEDTGLARSFTPILIV